MRPEIVLFGDSNTELSFSVSNGGWVAALADHFSRKADVLNRGYSGYNTRWALYLLDRIFPLGTTKPPIAATVFFGTNDAALQGRMHGYQHIPVDEYKENLKKIVHHLKECSPKMIVILVAPPPIHDDGRVKLARSIYGDKAPVEPERTNEAVSVYAKQCVELAKELGVPFVDLWSKMQETEGWQKKFLLDGAHLTTEGNAVVYREVVRELSNAGLSAIEMPYDFPHLSQIDANHPEKAFSMNNFP